MGNSRENSPDWLRSFQAPTRAIVTLSSSPEASLKNSPSDDDTADTKRDSTLSESQLIESDEDLDKVSSRRSGKSDPTKPVVKKTTRKGPIAGGNPAKKRKTKDLKKEAGKDDVSKPEEESSEKQTEVHEAKVSTWTLSSDSESDATLGNGNQPSVSKFDDKEVQDSMRLLDNEPIPKVPPKGKSPKKSKKTADMPTAKKKLEDEIETKGEPDAGVAEKESSEKHVEPRVSSSMLPLVLSDKVQRSKALVECEGDSIDMSGDVGAVGRVIVSEDQPDDKEMLLDLKGTIYRTTIVPSRTFCVVSVGPSEAKIEAIMSDFIQLKPQSNVYDAETMVEGTLDGFSFDSEDEGDKIPKAATHQGDQNEGAEDPTNVKTKKAAKKPTGLQKKGKSAVGKQVKKRKPPAGKKGRAKK